MTRHDVLFSLRFAAFAALLVIPLLGCICGDESLHDGYVAPNDPPACEASDGWTPERIELLDMSDDAALVDDASLEMLMGGQGSSMVGVYVAVYGDDIPGCLQADFDLEGFAGGGGGEWAFQADGPRRAVMTAPYYWVVDGEGASSLSVTIGDTTVTRDVTLDY